MSKPSRGSITGSRVSDTGILDGPRFRYVLPGAEGWRAADTWPLPSVRYDSLALCADGSLSAAEAVPTGSRTLDDARRRIKPGSGERRRSALESYRGTANRWSADLDVVGDIELSLGGNEHGGRHGMDRHTPRRRSRRNGLRCNRRLFARRFPCDRRSRQPAGRAGRPMPHFRGGADLASPRGTAYLSWPTRAASRQVTAYASTSRATTRIRRILR